jgi:hypothetical protein
MSYGPGSAEALTLGEAASQIAYCYYCQACGFRERVHLTRIAADYPPETRVGDLLRQLPCGQCGDTKKIVMTLWLRATTTDRTLEERGFPVWPDDH